MKKTIDFHKNPVCPAFLFLLAVSLFCLWRAIVSVPVDPETITTIFMARTDSTANSLPSNWPYSLALHFMADKYGAAGLEFFVGAQLVLAACLASACAYPFYWLPAATLVLIPAAIFSSSGLSPATLSFYPDIASLSLLFMECAGLETWMRKKNAAWAILVPFSIILETNINPVFSVLHFLLFAAYIFPSFIPGIANNDFEKFFLSKWKTLAACFIISLLALCIRSGGLNGLTGSMLEAVTEISWKNRYPYLFSLETGFILAIFAMTCLCFKHRALSSRTLNTAMVFSLATLFFARNAIFLSISVILAFKDLGEEKVFELINKHRLFLAYAFCLLALFMICAQFVSGEQAIEASKKKIGDIMEISSVLNLNVDKNSHIIAENPLGIYLKANGFANIIGKNDGHSPKWHEKYVEIMADGYRKKNGKTAFFDYRTIAGWLDNNKVEWIVIKPGENYTLRGWLMRSGEFRLYRKAFNQTLELYQRIRTLHDNFPPR